MKTLVCHPDNLSKKLERKIQKQLTQLTNESPFFVDFPVFNVRTDPYMERDKPTGRYVLPNGNAVDKEEIRIRHRFITYGPEDLPWLLYAGIVTEERELLFYLVDDLAFRVSMQDASFMPRMNLGSIFMGTV